ncbi:homocysteine S-methyltransferase family protein [Faecalispora anaeroviscerum]|uniref:homocysteine S-methyltransferase family protein n=1 Tax=Faecalispora anaeroviscerum TaxID=2991836 RepID=UPI0024B88BCF|nr:homocysteine S-methyltransferase family protein [Faecalispora anaeroviscerum]
MNVLECVRQGLFYLDGGTGSNLQAQGLMPGELPEMWNLNRPEEIIALHRAYYEAGSHAVCTNTFGANGLKFNGVDTPSVKEIIQAAVTCAKTARDTARGGQNNRFVALDIGPLGHLLAPLGDISFERAVELFAEQVRVGTEAGADFILIETMNDSYETKAALLAAKENCSLPVFVSNVYDESGKLMTGATPEAMVAMLEGLGADAIGINCSLGPERMLELMPRFLSSASVPVLVKPNAGLPRAEDGRTVYSVGPEEFAGTMKEIVSAGARIVGGCCGTTPDYIKALVSQTKEVAPVPVTPKHHSVITSYSRAVEFGGAPVLIGERINPTGKKRFKEALRSHDIGYILREGIAQEELGVHVLDVNVGLPEIDEPSMLTDCVRELQGVSGLPLQLDTSSPVAMERAMRIYNGKPMINSVNGSPESMEAVFPLVRKYGGLVVCLTLDEHGIPETAEGRLAIAERIARCAAEYGIGVHDLIFDPLAMTVSSDQTAAQVTLKTIPMIRERLGAGCSLGVSNISFGLPNRDFVTSAFFTMALTCGLTAAIMNPYSAEMRKSYYSYLALAGLDPNCQEYIRFAQNVTVETSSPAAAAAPAPGTEKREGLQGAIMHGLSEESSRLAREALQTVEPLALINEQIVPALDIVGQGFENKTVFLPQLLMSAEAAKAAFEEARRKMPTTDEVGPAVILATVKGDIHDIGKNIVKALMENYGYHVIDLGRDVPPETIVDAAIRNDVKLVGLSALMTTTVPSMAETIAQLRRKKPDCRVVVGGAVLTQEYADQIGADQYARNAMESVRYAAQVFQSEKGTNEATVKSGYAD